MVRIARSLAFVALLGVLAAGCSSDPPPPPPEPTVAQVNVTATEEANPDPTGRASPSVVFLYALKPGAPFETAEQDALLGDELGALAETMTRIARMVVVPGKTEKRIFELPDGITQVGIAVAYRQIETAKWRAKATVEENEVTLLLAEIGGSGVKID